MKPNHNWAPDRQAWLQKIFDKGSQGLIAQGKQSVEGTSCVYRDPDGNKCALGMCIPNSKYRKSWDDKEGGTTPYIGVSPDIAVAKIKRAQAVAKALGCKTDEEATALRDFQMCHDHASEEGDFLKSFTAHAHSFAMKYNLNTSVLG